MPSRNDRVVVAVTLPPLPYPPRDVEFMLPGIVHKMLGNDHQVFDLLVDQSISFLEHSSDRQGYLVKVQYYGRMADEVGLHLARSAAAPIIYNLLNTDYDVEDAEIKKNHDVFLEFRRRPSFPRRLQ